MNKDQAKALREPFPKSAIGKLPKGGTMLDYVGHAAVCDRLLAVDPEWTWEPLALDAEGLPGIDKAGNLWIRLTVAGVTRLGCGDGKNMKERIGDAIRNAAMRFGVALDLWAKEDLHEIAHAAASHETPPPPPPVEPPPVKPSTNGITPKQVTALSIAMTEMGFTDRDQCLDWIEQTIGRRVESRKDLTFSEAKTALDRAQMYARSKGAPDALL